MARQRKIFILTIGTRGDVQPFIYLAQALQRAGIKPLLITLPHFVHLGVEFGVQIASILEIGESWPDTGALADDGVESKKSFEERLILEPYAEYGCSMLHRIESLASEHSPDAIVVGMIIWFLNWLRETLKVPLVHAHLQPTRWLSTERSSDQSTRQVRFLELLASNALLDFSFMSARTDHPHELHLLAYPASLGVTHLPGVNGSRTGFWRATHAGTLEHQQMRQEVPIELARFLRGRGPPPVCLCFGSMPVYSRTRWSERS